MKKISNKFFEYGIKIFFLCLIISLLFGASLFITAIYLGDLSKAEEILNGYDFLQKSLIVFLSGFLIIWFSEIVKYLFITFVYEKED